MSNLGLNPRYLYQQINEMQNQLIGIHGELTDLLCQMDRSAIFDRAMIETLEEAWEAVDSAAYVLGEVMPREALGSAYVPSVNPMVDLSNVLYIKNKNRAG